MKKISVIIPVYNEEKKLAETLSEVETYLRGRFEDYEVLVVLDGCTDRSAEIAKQIAAASTHVKVLDFAVNRGKGEVLREGIAKARFSHCLFLDADNSTSIREFEAFPPLFEKGARAVVASRHLPGSIITHPQPWLRRFLGSGYRALSRILFGIKGTDFNCGFKAYETELAKMIFSQTIMRDWTFDVELFCLLKKNRVRWTEVPVRWEHQDKKSQLAPVSTALRSLKSLLQLKRRF